MLIELFSKRRFITSLLPPHYGFYFLSWAKNAFVIYAASSKGKQEKKKKDRARRKKNLAKMNFRERYCDSPRMRRRGCDISQWWEGGRKKRLIHLVCTPHGRQLLSHSAVPGYRMEMNSAGVSFHEARSRLVLFDVSVTAIFEPSR